MSYITNANEENFGTLTSGADVTVSHYSAILNYGIAGEIVLITNAIGTSRTYTAGDDLVLPAGSMDLNLPAGNGNDNAIKEMIDTYLAAKTGGITVSLGIAAMTTTGKANEIPSSRGYTRQVVETTTGTGNAPA